MNEFQDRPQFESFTEADYRINDQQYGITYEEQQEIELERIRFNYFHPPCKRCGRHCSPVEIYWTIYEICNLCDLWRIEDPNWKDLQN